jgi:predicted Rossmann fold nucleotide-binding protein DprA/Smf involved in DNA uptake
MKTINLGNSNLLNLPKTAFLCSRQIPASVILKCYDWAIEQREKEACIICGNHSQIEKDVFEILLKGRQALILVLARSFYKKWDKHIQKAIDDNRLLIITPFTNAKTQVTSQTAYKRNEFILSAADKIVIGHIHTGGTLERLLKGKKYQTL